MVKLILFLIFVGYTTAYAYPPKPSRISHQQVVLPEIEGQVVNRTTDDLSKFVFGVFVARASDMSERNPALKSGRTVCRTRPPSGQILTTSIVDGKFNLPSTNIKTEVLDGGACIYPFIGQPGSAPIFLKERGYVLTGKAWGAPIADLAKQIDLIHYDYVLDPRYRNIRLKIEIPNNFTAREYVADIAAHLPQVDLDERTHNPVAWNLNDKSFKLPPTKRFKWFLRIGSSRFEAINEQGEIIKCQSYWDCKLSGEKLAYSQTIQLQLRRDLFSKRQLSLDSLRNGTPSSPIYDRELKFNILISVHENIMNAAKNDRFYFELDTGHNPQKKSTYGYTDVSFNFGRLNSPQPFPVTLNADFQQMIQTTRSPHKHLRGRFTGGTL